MSAGGAIESPSPGTSAVRESLVVAGWALLPAATVARVEVRVGGCTVGLARLGLPRPDVAAATGRADAPVCGFDYPVPARSLPSEHTEIDVDVLVHGVDGSCVALPALTVSLTPAEPVSPEVELEAAGLRERVRSAVRTETMPRTGARVLVVTSSLNRGAASRALFHLLRRLVAGDGLSCDVVTAETGTYAQRLEAAGVPVHVTPAWPAHDAGRYEGGLAQLAAWASGQGFDVVVVDGPEAFVGAISPRGSRPQPSGRWATAGSCSTRASPRPEATRADGRWPRRGRLRRSPSTRRVRARPSRTEDSPAAP